MNQQNNNPQQAVEVSDEEAAKEKYPDIKDVEHNSVFQTIRLQQREYFLEGRQSLRQQLSKEQGGMRWVNLSQKEDLPPQDWEGIAFVDDNIDTHTYYSLKWNFETFSQSAIKWLDESANNKEQQQKDLLLKVSADVIAYHEQAIAQKDALLKDMAELIKQSNLIIKSIMPEQINTEDAGQVNLYHSFHFNNDALARYNQLQK